MIDKAHPPICSRTLISHDYRAQSIQRSNAVRASGVAAAIAKSIVLSNLDGHHADGSHANTVLVGTQAATTTPLTSLLFSTNFQSQSGIRQAATARSLAA